MAEAAVFYHCRRCGGPRAAKHVRRMRSGYVARYLTCGHTVAVTTPPLDGDLAQAVVPHAHAGEVEALMDRLRASLGTPPLPADEHFDCRTCYDGSVVSNTCDDCGERHCPDCDPCTRTRSDEAPEARPWAEAAPTPAGWWVVVDDWCVIASELDYGLAIMTRDAFNSNDPHFLGTDAGRLAAAGRRKLGLPGWERQVSA